MVDDRGAELRAFLRAMRGRLRPEDVGLPTAGRRRRTAGLRIEEAAALAGVSLTWYSALEGGKGARVSANLLARVGDALRLSPEEREMLAALAARKPRPRAVDDTAYLRAIVDGFTSGPAFVSDRFWNIAAHNMLADAVYGIAASGERNQLVRMLLDPAFRKLHEDWERIAQQMVGIAHLSFGYAPDDPHGIALVERLRASSPEFTGWWDHYTLRRFVPTRAMLHHPTMGRLSLLFTSFIASALRAADDALIIIFQPAADQATMRAFDETRAASGSLTGHRLTNQSD